MTLARHERHEQVGAEAVHHLWVVGDRGAVSTWFVAHPALDHAVCIGANVHSPRPLDGLDPHGPCDFLETDCWFRPGTMLWLEPIKAAYAAGELDVIWKWLEGYYEALAEEVVFAELAERSGLR